jgi:hypothetical protein
MKYLRKIILLLLSSVFIFSIPPYEPKLLNSKFNKYIQINADNVLIDHNHNDCNKISGGKCVLNYSKKIADDGINTISFRTHIQNPSSFFSKLVYHQIGLTYKQKEVHYALALVDYNQRWQLAYLALFFIYFDKVFAIICDELDLRLNNDDKWHTNEFVPEAKSHRITFNVLNFKIQFEEEGINNEFFLDMKKATPGPFDVKEFKQPIYEIDYSTYLTSMKRLESGVLIIKFERIEDVKTYKFEYTIKEKYFENKCEYFLEFLKGVFVLNPNKVCDFTYNGKFVGKKSKLKRNLL